MIPIRRILAHSGFPVLLAALALLLSAPAWRLPLTGDDLVQASKLLHNHPVKLRGYFSESHRFGPAMLTLFDWFRPDLTRGAMEAGVLPWWTAPDAKQSFWRPLSAATHWLDYRLWPSRALPMHLHNALWLMAFVLAAWTLYRAVEERAWVAGLAALLLALNQENGQTVSWIAARNSLVTVCFAALTLLLHHRHATRGAWRWEAAAVCAFAAGLLAGEGGVAAGAYLAGHALFLDPRPWRKRLPGLAAFAAVMLAWRLAYQQLGFGVWNSGLYIDPGAEPLRYGRNLLEWGPLVLAQVFSFPLLGQYASLAPALQPWARALSWGGLAVLAGLACPLLRARRDARFWAFGLVLTLAPACATAVPDDRITLYASLGMAPLAAAWVAAALEGTRGRRAFLPRAALAGGALLAVGFHLLLPLPGHVKRLALLLRAPPPPARLDGLLKANPDEELILVNPPDVMGLSYLPYVLVWEGADMPNRMRTLSSAPGDLVARRTDARTLVLSSSPGSLIPARPHPADFPPPAPRRHSFYRSRMIATAFRRDGLRFEPGARVGLPGLTVVVDRVDARGFPTEARFTFERPLEDIRYRWIYWDSAASRYAPFIPPDVGGERRLRGLFSSSP